MANSMQMTCKTYGNGSPTPGTCNARHCTTAAQNWLRRLRASMMGTFIPWKAGDRAPNLMVLRGRTAHLHCHMRPFLCTPHNCFRFEESEDSMKVLHDTSCWSCLFKKTANGAKKHHAVICRMPCVLTFRCQK
eukprot:2239568-Amphidinium_carterae.2